MKNRFDLEQEILDCWKVTDDIDILLEYVCDGENDQDYVANVLLGLKNLYDLKFDRTFATFEECIKNGQLAQ